LARKEAGNFFITSEGNDMARNMAPLTRRIALIERAKKEVEQKKQALASPDPDTVVSEAATTKK
jgi:hypothetical protein